LESGSDNDARTGDAEILVDDRDALVGPAELARFVGSAYCRSVDSRLCSTWAALDWRR
jgi:hypothetical protein